MKLLKNKKGKYFLTIVSIMLIIALSTMLYLINKNQELAEKRGELGLKANLIVDSFQDAERVLFFMDMAAKYSAEPALFMTAFNGALPRDSPCGKYYNFMIWDFEDDKCIPMGAGRPIKSAVDLQMNDLLNDYFGSYQGFLIPKNNFDINLFEENGKLVVTGGVITPLTFEIKRPVTQEGQVSKYQSAMINPATAMEFLNDPRVRWIAANKQHVTPEFLNKLIQVAADVGANPLHLMIVMRLETGSTFSPSIKNPKSGATGLIQFMPKTATGLGTTTAELSQMSAIEQLDYVRTYLLRQRNAAGLDRFETLTQLYLSVLYPIAMKNADRPEAIVFKAGSKAQRWNSGFIPSGRADKNVYVKDVESSLIRGWERVPTLGGQVQKGQQALVPEEEGSDATQ